MKNMNKIIAEALTFDAVLFVSKNSISITYRNFPSPYTTNSKSPNPNRVKSISDTIISEV